MKLIPVLYNGATAHLRADTCEVLGIVAHQVVPHSLWADAVMDEYQRRKAGR